METLLIIDFGSQYNQLIARRVRESKVYCEIVPPTITADQIRAKGNVKGIILSGGPASVYLKNAPQLDAGYLELGLPIFGICYGMQALSHLLGGKVCRAEEKEFGRADLFVKSSGGSLFKGVPRKSISWMSHGDYVSIMPKGFQTTAFTKNTKVAAFENDAKKIYGVQFHPEVAHSEHGKKVIENFIKVCGFKKSWTMENFIKEKTREIKEKVGTDHVILGLSGGVDSSVAAALMAKALGKQLTCIFVNNGLLRKNEVEYVRQAFAGKFNFNLDIVDAEKHFLTALKGVTDPEKKRKVIGHEFIYAFDREAKKIKNAKWLGQGTLYPDVIESKSAFGGPTAVIKSHHNVGGLPEKMKLKLIEPLRELFKDEVRELGKSLGLPKELVWRHPFPGPGLAVRVLGEVTKERCDILREADHRFLEELHKSGLYTKIWQAFAVLLPVRSVGVMGDERTYDNVVALRAVTSVDGMTADWFDMPKEVLGKVSNRIINEVKGVNRVCYDVSSKPPATIEWE